MAIFSPFFKMLKWRVFSWITHVFDFHKYKQHIYFLMVDVSSCMLSSPFAFFFSFPLSLGDSVSYYFPSFLRGGQCQGRSIKCLPFRIMTLESVQWECNVQFALSRTFGNEVDFVQWSWPLCANSNVQNEDLTTLQVSSLYLYLFLLWNGALLWDVSRLSLIWVVPYSCLLLLWHTLPILLNVYLHQNLTTMPIFDLPLSLNVGILP